jgi:hypothetical protein
LAGINAFNPEVELTSRAKPLVLPASEMDIKNGTKIGIPGYRPKNEIGWVGSHSVCLCFCACPR